MLSISPGNRTPSILMHVIRVLNREIPNIADYEAAFKRLSARDLLLAPLHLLEEAFPLPRSYT